MSQRQQSTSTYALRFLLVDAADHVTGKTGLSPTLTVCKPGASAFSAASATVTELANGWYQAAGAGLATDLNTLGENIFRLSAAGADPHEKVYDVVAWNPFLGMSAALTGPYTVTISVVDNLAAPVEGATVRLYRVGETETKSTNAAVAIPTPFAVVAATWSLAISAVGFDSLTSSIVVTNANVTPSPYVLTRRTVPSVIDSSLSVGVLLCKLHNGPIAPGVNVYVQLTRDPPGAGRRFSRAVWNKVSDANGYVYFGGGAEGMVRGARYDIWSDDANSPRFSLEVPDAPSFVLPDIFA